MGGQAVESATPDGIAAPARAPAVCGALGSYQPWRVAKIIEGRRRALGLLLSVLAESGRGELSPDLRLGMEGVSLFHAWWHRYRNRLRAVNPVDLLA